MKRAGEVFILGSQLLDCIHRSSGSNAFGMQEVHVVGVAIAFVTVAPHECCAYHGQRMPCVSGMAVLQLQL